MKTVYAKWIRFVPNISGEKKRKTKCWIVYPKDIDSSIGLVRWFPQWRKYGFFPDMKVTVFEPDCRRDIANFLEKKTREHRVGMGKVDLKTEKSRLKR